MLFQNRLTENEEEQGHGEDQAVQSHDANEDDGVVDQTCLLVDKIEETHTKSPTRRPRFSAETRKQAVDRKVELMATSVVNNVSMSVAQ